VVRLDGSGDPLRLRAAAFLEVVIRAPTHDQHYRPVLTPTRLRPDFPALREVNAPDSFEGQTTAGIGLTQRVGFRVLELTNPTRIVIDLAHPATDGVIGEPVGLVVSPSSGPVGTKVTVEGQGCDSGSASTSTYLVFQSGQGGTVGAVDFGEIPNDKQGRFRTTVAIPARMDVLQGIGGGPTRPGTYQFTTRPPGCAATFTVTSSPPGPAGRPGRCRSPAPTPRCCLPSAAGSSWLARGWFCWCGATPGSPPSTGLTVSSQASAWLLASVPRHGGLRCGRSRPTPVFSSRSSEPPAGVCDLAAPLA
jgi:hypothetical protein